jgi:hypothetical protein
MLTKIYKKSYFSYFSSFQNFRVLQFSSRVRNQIFVGKNAIEYRYGTLLKLDVQTLWVTMQLWFLQKKVSLANNSSSLKTELGNRIQLKT